MARSKEEIRSQIISQLPSEWNLTNSATAVWRVIVDAITSAIYIFESLQDIFKSEIEQKIDQKRIGSADWYVQKTKEFQIDSQLQFFPDGTIGYPTIDPTKQIITFAILTDGDNEATLKVAKQGSDGQLSPLSEAEKLQLKNYLELIKIVGTKINVVSLPADIIAIEANIFYNPIYTETDVAEALNNALLDFQRQDISGYFRRNEFIAYLRNLDQIKDIEILSLSYTQGTNTGNIDLEYEIISGYFNYSADCVYNLIPKYN